MLGYQAFLLVSIAIGFYCLGSFSRDLKEEEKTS
jgi:hypothetical protein